MHCSIAFRGVAGSYLYTVYIDDEPIALLEDRQTDVRFIHTDVVHNASQVVVVPLSYPDMREGTKSLPVTCVSL